MKKVIFFLFIIVVNVSTFGEPFDYLKKIIIDECNKASLNYDSKYTKIINLKFDRSKENEWIQLISINRIVNKNSEIYIYFSPGPTYASYFIIDNDNNIKNGNMGTIHCESLYITSNGLIYCEQRYSQWYNQKRKYKINNGKVEEVIQPFYLVDIESTTQTNLQLYSDFDLKIPNAILPKGYSVKIIGEKKEKFLIGTDFGLIGWAIIEDKYMEGVTFKEIFRYSM